MATLARPAPRPGLPQKATPNPPHPTYVFPPPTIIKSPQLTLPSLYIRNLPDKLPKADLKRNLYMLFSPHGVILDVVALKTPKMRGQAHVVFRDIDSSTQAMRALEASTFFGKDIVRGDTSIHLYSVCVP